ncbi:MAG: hypothetical protein M8835_08305, partial [marine benthic group bacterium]|nr:hypothetical protein [Gemmatimonadota bacterium]
MKLSGSRIVRTSALPLFVAVTSLLAASPLLAQDEASLEAAQAEESQSQADLAKQIQNPLASVVTLPFQANHNQNVGEF